MFCCFFNDILSNFLYIIYMCEVDSIVDIIADFSELLSVIYTVVEFTVYEAERRRPAPRSWAGFSRAAHRAAHNDV